MGGYLLWNSAVWMISCVTFFFCRFVFVAGKFFKEVFQGSVANVEGVV